MTDYTLGLFAGENNDGLLGQIDLEVDGPLTIFVAQYSQKSKIKFTNLIKPAESGLRETEGALEGTMANHTLGLFGRNDESLVKITLKSRKQPVIKRTFYEGLGVEYAEFLDASETGERRSHYGEGSVIGEGAWDEGEDGE